MDEGKKIWKKCLVFDLCCICLAFGLILTGTGKGAGVKQELKTVAAKWEMVRQTSGAAGGGDTSVEKKK